MLQHVRALATLAGISMTLGVGLAVAYRLAGPRPYPFSLSVLFTVIGSHAGVAAMLLYALREGAGYHKGFEEGWEAGDSSGFQRGRRVAKPVVVNMLPKQMQPGEQVVLQPEDEDVDSG